MSLTLVVVDTTHTPSPNQLTFDMSRVVIGRGRNADVRLPSREVGETHAVIRNEPSELSITDDGSTNGTRVNDQPLVRGRKRALTEGDRITIGSYQITIARSVAGADPPERTLSVARRLVSEAMKATGNEVSPPALVLLTGERAGETWLLESPTERFVIGRGEGCHIVLDDADCSRQHAEIARDADGGIVRDLASRNGVFVGERPARERRLRDGDDIHLGRSTLRYHDPVDRYLRALEGGPDDLARVAPPPPTASTPHAPSSLSSADRRAPTLPPPPLEPPSSPPAAPRGATADWVVIGLALVILIVSAAALYVLLHPSGR